MRRGGCAGVGREAARRAGSARVAGGHVVSCAELVEAIWDGAPPAGARVTVRAYVMRLRQALGPGLAVRVVTQKPGYLLQAAADEVDLLLFDRLCAEGAAAVQAGAWQRVWHLLGQALELWSGEPLADVSCEGMRRGLLPRLASIPGRRT